jgi:hypothetical protein
MLKKKPLPARIWTQGRWWWQRCLNTKNNHLWLAFGREGVGGNGGGGRAVV